MLTADATFQTGAGLATLCHGNLHQATNSNLIQALERVARENLVFHVVRKELASVVSAVTESHLGQIVRTEAEELGRLLGNLLWQRLA